MTNMVAQSRQLKQLVENHQHWIALYKRLKGLLDEDIDGMEQDANKLAQNQRKFNDTLNNQNIEDSEDLIRKI